LASGQRAAGQRATGHTGNRTLTPAAMFAVGLMTGLGAFFLAYASIFVRTGPTALFTPLPVDTPGRIQAEMPVIISLMSYY
jgi:hypothetical protein